MAPTSNPSKRIREALEVLARRPSCDLDLELTRTRTPQEAGVGLFCYGTLTIPAVMGALLDRTPPSVTGTCPGWRAAGLEGLPYPGLVRHHVPAGAGASSGAPGRLYMDLTDHEWQVLDAFENPGYEVAVVDVDVDVGMDSGTQAEAGGFVTKAALAYRWPRLDTVLPHDWTLKSMDDETMEEYLEGCVTWRKEWEAESESTAETPSEALASETQE
jgi:hypothetical protein